MAKKKSMLLAKMKSLLLQKAWFSVGCEWRDKTRREIQGGGEDGPALRSLPSK